MKIPTYAIDLIEELDKSYPNKHPNLSDTEREVWFKAGQRSVVDNLLSIVQDQQEEGELPQLLNKDK
jgi:hypothetical protein